MTIYVIEIREDYETEIGGVYLSKEKAEAAAEDIRRGFRDAWVRERTIEDPQTGMKVSELSDWYQRNIKGIIEDQQRYLEAHHSNSKDYERGYQDSIRDGMEDLQALIVKPEGDQ